MTDPAGTGDYTSTERVRNQLMLAGAIRANY